MEKFTMFSLAAVLFASLAVGVISLEYEPVYYKSGVSYMETALEKGISNVVKRHAEGTGFPDVIVYEKSSEECQGENNTCAKLVFHEADQINGAHGILLSVIDSVNDPSKHHKDNELLRNKASAQLSEDFVNGKEATEGTRKVDPFQHKELSVGAGDDDKDAKKFYDVNKLALELLKGSEDLSHLAELFKTEEGKAKFTKIENMYHMWEQNEKINLATVQGAITAISALRGDFQENAELLKAAPVIVNILTKKYATSSPAGTKASDQVAKKTEESWQEWLMAKFMEYFIHKPWEFIKSIPGHFGWGKTNPKKV